MSDRNRKADELAAPEGVPPNWRERLIAGFRRASERLLGPWRGGRSLLEIRQAALGEALEQVTYVGSGLRVFPYNLVTIRLRPLDAQERAVMLAAQAEDWAGQIRGLLLERLEQMECTPSEVRVEVVVGPIVDPATPEPGPPYQLSLERVEHRPVEEEEVELLSSERRPRLELEVIRGRAERDHYAFDRHDRILIGRLDEVLDEHGRIKRRNHVAFADDGDENHTVSREQARIAYRARGYWLVDERSAYGTRIFRSGRPIDVSSRDRRGIRLRDGDEIYFGQAAVVCRLPEEE